jgi:long-subunit acyl-CoA synthetase (AMP-forming)
MQRRALSSSPTAADSGAPLPSPSDYVDYDFQTLHELIEKACQHYPKHNIFGVRRGDQYEYLSYADFHSLYSTARTLLATEYGVKENDKVAIISNNRVEWAALMYATVSLGAQWVPM